ncbi:MAG: hypothetical protein GF400_07810 [Candidatus Eisenbacteria bacterium]|nr:hypothetical protein [Candidatus Eisenbacteria bacterium]
MLRSAVFVSLLAALLAAATAAAPARARVYELDECIEIALAENIALAQARQGVAGADADVLSSWSGVLPRVSGSLSTGSTMSVAGGASTTAESASGGITVSQTVFDASTFASISAALHGRDAERNSLESTLRQVVFGVREAYYGLLKAEALRDVQMEAVELAKEQLRKTESLFELGSASRSDLLKAQVQVGQAELQLITAERTAETSRAALCLSMGIDVTTDLEAADPPEQAAAEDLEAYDLEEALARRPDIRSAEEQLTAARRSLFSARSDRLPSLGFSMSYSRSRDDFGELFEDVRDDYTRTMSLSLSVPIFNGMSTKASVDRWEATLRTYELSLLDLRQQAEYEIETARLFVREQKERVAVTQQAVAQAEEDLRVSEERFRLRAASMLELIDARVAYSRARADLVEARYDHEVAKAELKLALGL